MTVTRENFSLLSESPCARPSLGRADWFTQFDHPLRAPGPFHLRPPPQASTSAMKILCDRTQLQEAFAIVGSVVPVKTTKPILQNVLLTADEDGIALFATDLEMAAHVRLDAVKVHKKGRALLPARECAALLRELSDPTVTLEHTEQRCKIDSGGGAFVLLGEDPEQFPEA